MLRTLGIIPAIGKQQLNKGLNNRSNPLKWASQVVKNPPANAGDVRDSGSIPALGRSAGGGHGNPLQFSCLENPMDRGVWWAIVHEVTKSWTQLKQLSLLSLTKS